MKCALYIRVSTDAQAEEGYSIEEQTERLKAYCKARGWRAVKIYTDAGFTGSNIKRPGIESLIKDAAKYDAVIVYKLDRLSRSQKDTLFLIEEVFLKNGVDFISINENFDTSTSFGRAMIGILSVFAQLEREQIKERMTMGKIGRAKKGLSMCFGTPPFGYTYEDNLLHIDPIAAGIVKDIYGMYLSGVSINKIMDDLNAAGRFSKTQEWRHVTIRNVLHNPVYTGRNKYKGTLYNGNHTAIISVEDFEKVQKEIECRQTQAYEKNGVSRPFQSRYMLSGLLCCPRCGARFGLMQGGIRKDGTRKKIYQCYSQVSRGKHRTSYRNPDGCDADTYPLADLENLVLGEIEKLRLDPAAAAKDTQDSAEEIKALEWKLLEASKSLERLVSLYVKGNLPLEILDSEREKIEIEKTGMEKRIGQLKEKTPAMSMVDVNTLFAAFPADIRAVEYGDQKKIVNALISEISLNSDTVRIKWRFV